MRLSPNEVGSIRTWSGCRRPTSSQCRPKTVTCQAPAVHSVRLGRTFTSVPTESSSPLPDRGTWERRVARALEIARRRAGMTQAEAVEALSPYQSRSSSSSSSRRQRWYDWVARPVSVSSLALIAAAHLARMTVDELLAEAGLPQTPRQAEDSGELRRQLAEVQDELARQRALNAGVQGRLDELAARVEGRRLPVAVPTDAPAMATLHDMLRAIAVLEDDITEVGRQVGREWDTRRDHNESLSRADVLRRRMGALEARTAEVATMVGAPYGGYPSAPASSDAEDDSFRTWLAEVLAILQRQLPVIRQQARQFSRTADASRKASQDR